MSNINGLRWDLDALCTSGIYLGISRTPSVPVVSESDKKDTEDQNPEGDY